MIPGNTGDGRGGLVDEAGVNGVEEAGADLADRGAQHAQDGEHDDQADDRVGELPAQGHAGGAEEHGETREPVGAGVEPVNGMAPLLPCIDFPCIDPRSKRGPQEDRSRAGRTIACCRVPPCSRRRPPPRHRGAEEGAHRGETDRRSPISDNATTRRRPGRRSVEPDVREGNQAIGGPRRSPGSRESPARAPPPATHNPALGPPAGLPEVSA